MARQRTPLIWVDRVRSTYARLMGARERSSAAAVVRALEREYGESADCPRERTVYRLLREFDQLGAEERRDYDSFQWPRSMEQGALPWEASRDLLDLQRHISELGAEIPIRSARCYWRASLAMPDADIELRRLVASQLAMWEVSGVSPAHRRESLHWYLTYAPWRSPENRTAYLSAVKSGDVQPFHAEAAAPDGTDVGEMLGALLGIHDPTIVKIVEEARATPLSEQAKRQGATD